MSDIDRIEQKIDQATSARDQLEHLTRTLFSRKSVNFTYKGLEAETDGGERIPLDSLSAGEKQALRILIEVVRAEANSLIIDEPEIALHIDWQRKLVPFMRTLNPRAQVIMATHSPEIMAEIPDSSVFAL